MHDNNQSRARTNLKYLAMRAEYEDSEAGYETSDDESCDLGSQDFDTMSSCRSRARSCCSVTTVANDDFEYFQRKGTKVVLFAILSFLYFRNYICTFGWEKDSEFVSGVLSAFATGLGYG